MTQIGKWNELKALREAPPGWYLDGKELGEILLPKKYIPKDAELGDTLRVFVYADSEDRLVATMENPYATADEFAVLEVLSVHREIGAFLAWGLAKDLLLPFREQTNSLRPRDWVLVYLKLDPKTRRMVATARVHRFLKTSFPDYKPGDAVDVLVAERTPLGHQVIVENAYRGFLFHDHTHSPLYPGERRKAYVKEVKSRGQIDLSLDASGYGRVRGLTDSILDALKESGGRLPLGDETPPETIRREFGVSKKAFKQALGALYKARKIRFTQGGIERCSSSRSD